MKKGIALFVILSVLFSFTACSPSIEHPEYLEPTILSDGTIIRQSALGNLTYSLKSLPFDLEVEGKAVPLKDVKFFETHIDHGYVGYVVITLGRERLTDDDIHWITSYDSKKFCKTLQINLYADSDENEVDTESLTRLGCIYDDTTIYYSFRSDRYRYSLLNSNFSAQIIVTPSGITEKDTVYYHYDHIITSETYSDSTASLSPGELSALRQSGYSGPITN